MKKDLLSCNEFTSLQGTLALFAEGTYCDLSDRAVKRVKASEVNIFRLVNLINQLLDMEKIEAGMLKLHPSNFFIVPLIQQAIESIRAFAEQNEITIEEPESADDIEVYADEQRTSQVLTNLISNAIKYSPAGKNVWINIVKVDNYAEIQIIDQGVGIPEQYKQKIFDRFQRVERGAEKHASTGL
jgi:signal transduction histidine kinase